eukprot:3621288-Rhodomonas_salina.1
MEELALGPATYRALPSSAYRQLPTERYLGPNAVVPYLTSRINFHCTIHVCPPSAYLQLPTERYLARYHHLTSRISLHRTIHHAGCGITFVAADRQATLSLSQVLELVFNAPNITCSHACRHHCDLDIIGRLRSFAGGADSSSVAAIVGSMCQQVVKAVKEGNATVIADVRKVTLFGSGLGFG